MTSKNCLAELRTLLIVALKRHLPQQDEVQQQQQHQQHEQQQQPQQARSS